MLTADSGSGTNWYARHVRMRGRMRGSLSGTLATMGCAVPYAIGAKYAHPDRPAYALVGDGAMQMNGINELITIAQVLAGLGRPAARGRGTAEQRPQPSHLGAARAWAGHLSSCPPNSCPTSLTPAMPAVSGCDGILVEKPEQVASAWDEAMAADRPCVVQFMTDPAVPPIPPHATWEQMEKALESIVRGDSDRVDVIKEGVKAKIQELLPGGASGS